MRASFIVVMLALIVTPVRADVTTSLPSSPPKGVDAALWARMVAVDTKAGKIIDLTADFEQQKFTQLLKKPMISTGTVHAKGTAMLWDTRTPEPTMMRVDESEVQILYPHQNTVEIYPLAGQWVAMPRL